MLLWVNIFIFFIVILVFNSIVFLFVISKYYDGYIKKPEKGYDAFILSDSHGLSISNYSEEYNVFNFSAGSDSYFDMKRKITFLLENDYIFDKIYITVDDHTLSPYREKANNLDRSSVYTSSNEYESHFDYLKEKYICSTKRGSRLWIAHQAYNAALELRVADIVTRKVIITFI